MASVDATMKAINEACRSRGRHYSTYSCQVVSWDDVSRGTVGGSLSCWGANITDTYLKSRHGKNLFTVRSDNWNEKLGVVKAEEVAVVASKSGGGPLQPVTLRSVLQQLGEYGSYAGLTRGTDLSNAALDAQCSIRFQTTFIPVEEGADGLGKLEFATEAYNYNTMDDSDPKNLLLLCTSQGLAVQQDGCGRKRLYHHAVDKQGKIHRYWLEAEESSHAVGGPQVETAEEKADALCRGKATSSVIGTRAMGQRFNVLMTIQVPLKQTSRPRKATADMFLTSLDGTICVTTTSCYAQEYSPSLANILKCAEETPRSACANRGRSIRDRSVRDRSRSRGRPAAHSSAARVSRGTEFDTWKGLTVKAPTRHEDEHVTITVVVYNVVKGGTPTEQDIIRAIDDLEKLYAACSTNAHLAEDPMKFMTKSLKVQDLVDISCKTQFQPPSKEVEEHGVFPTA
mmetsp:Transcript_49710/g.93047  ORF Transcript_49710/g.93047 Transcript_49710/m.93047 type:complete len:455 (+) Transcript_49710:68-1432(+)